MKKVLVALINFYQTFLSFDHGVLALLAPGGACKYPMSCSEYTKRAIIKHGTINGIWMGIKRVRSCR